MRGWEAAVCVARLPARGFGKWHGLPARGFGKYRGFPNLLLSKEGVRQAAGNVFELHAHGWLIGELEK